MNYMTMKKIIFIAISFFLLPIKTSLAVNIGNITEIISSNEETLAKEIENTVNTARLVNLSIEKIDSPLEGERLFQLIILMKYYLLQQI
ncbi:Uncharacterised protein [Providencia rustigianii]|nr:Uncharacterised protein [Providencia rustigianii]